MSAPAQQIHEQALPDIIVNGEMIDADAIGREAQFHPAASRDEALYGAARALVIRALLLQRARALGLLRPDEAEESAIDALLAQEVQTPEPDEAACRRHYEAHLRAWTPAPLLLASHILLAAAPDDGQARQWQRLQADKLLERLEAGEMLSQLAQAHSACPSSDAGGYLGEIAPGSTVSEFERQVFALPEGLHCKPIETRYGFHLVYVHKRVDAQPLPFHAVAAEIATRLRESVRHTATRQYLQILVGEATIEGFEMAGVAAEALQ